MSAATSADRNQESVGNTMGAPGVVAQQKIEAQAASDSVSTNQQPGEGNSDHHQQSGSSEQQQQQTGDDKHNEQKPKA